MIRFVVLCALTTLAHGWINGCGKSKYSNAGDGDVLQIVGGSEARSNEFPWQVSIQNAAGSHQCGAIIISTNKVLTAAHCTDGRSASSIYLRVGEHDRSRVDGPEATYRVSSNNIHPQYNRFTFNNDIAVLTTTTAIQLNNNVAAACKPAAGNDYSGSTAVVSGWGVTQSGGFCCPQILRYVQVPVVTNNACMTGSYGYSSGEITQGMICAGQSGRDACQMDSGGPLVVKSGDTFSVIGIVSWGRGCATAYGVYARVSNYLSWIDSQM